MSNRTPFELRAEDNTTLSATWFLPGPSPQVLQAAVVVVPGGGVRAGVYEGLAEALADRGFAVLTFDCRGIGGSRRGPLRNLVAGVEHWGGLDTEAALVAAVGRYPELPLFAVVHSVGGLFLGAAPSARRLKRIVFLAPHTGYWRDYARPWRWLLFAIFHVFMPAVTQICGYFPASRLGLGQDLPALFALQWARRRQPKLLVTQEDVARFGATIASYAEVSADALVVSMCDDAFATPAGAERICELYPSMIARREVIERRETGLSEVSHFAFRYGAGQAFFADRITAWFLRGCDTRVAGQRQA